ncbi:MAG: alkaline phosphatase family protein, partial [Deltaproteobacteria bacterium]|nr:alkaline phosphatase family protein [Deltaproteobacteria bacterium]
MITTKTTTASLPIRDRYVFLFNIDGAMIEELEKHLQAGQLPKIKELFFEKGARFKNAFTVYPTLSAPAHQSFLSGLQPGHHGVPSLDYLSRPLERYVDFLHPRDLLANNHLLFNFLQVYEDKISSDKAQFIFGALKPYPSLSILEGFNSGVTQTTSRPSLAHPAFHGYFAKRFPAVDFYAMDHLFKVIQESPLEDLPRFSMVDFYSLDLTSHYLGARGEESLKLYHHYDQFFSHLETLLKERGIWEKTNLVLLADHGQHLVAKRTFDLEKLFQDIGFKANSKKMLKGNILWGNHATGYSNLYFKMGENWKKAPSYEEIRNFPIKGKGRLNLVEVFSKNPNISLVLAKGKGFSVELHSKEGESRILRKRKNGEFYYRYQLIKGKDPLAYDQVPKIKSWMDQAKYLDQETWLQETADLDYPDSVVAIASIFDDGRAGDLILNSAPHQQFKKPFVYGHGSLVRSDRIVPLFFYGPDIKPGIYPHARLIDVAPTILAIFGRSSLGPIDGTLRKEILKPQTLKEWQEIGFDKNRSSPGLSRKAFAKDLEVIEKEKSKDQESREKA